ncbi:MAG: hypothetical protein IPG07_08485 [Crocinitomicaceae bacterium]|nr:hypothetical protein [Crocinitomicaceae bacterium]
MKNNQIIKSVGFWINKSMSISEFTTFITILPIENILQPILRKNGIIGSVNQHLMPTGKMQNLDPEIFEKSLLSIKCPRLILEEADMVDLLQSMTKYTFEWAEVFFDKWSELSYLNKFMEDIPQVQLAKYFGQGATFRKAIVFKLSDNPNYSNYMNWLIDGMHKRHLDQKNDTAIRAQYEAVKELKGALEKL